VIGLTVETTDLLETVAGSLVAGVGVTFAFSVLILGAVRSADFRREDRPVMATAAAGLAMLGLVAVAGAIVLGIIVMTAK
jgi:hypothetical protein